jgi:ankyrin repeat protein
MSQELLDRVAQLNLRYGRSETPEPLSNPLDDGRLPPEEANLAIYSVMRVASVAHADAEVTMRRPDALERLKSLPPEETDPRRTFDAFERTLFHAAAREGRTDVLNFLMRRGHDPAALDRFGFTPRDHALFEYHLCTDADKRHRLLATARHLGALVHAYATLHPDQHQPTTPHRVAGTRLG